MTKFTSLPLWWLWLFSIAYLVGHFGMRYILGR